MHKGFCVAFAALLLAGPAAASNTGIDALTQTPVSLFSYGLSRLADGVHASFAGENPPPFASFASPLSGRIADISTIVYDGATNTVLVNLVRINKLPEGATPDDACSQAMAALRTYALVDPATGQLQPGTEFSGLASAFAVDGTSIANAGAVLTALDKAFVLRFSGLADKRFSCRAPLFDAGYTMDK
jgi:hypothetical protein